MTGSHTHRLSEPRGKTALRTRVSSLAENQGVESAISPRESPTPHTSSQFRNESLASGQYWQNGGEKSRHPFVNFLKEIPNEHASKLPGVASWAAEHHDLVQTPLITGQIGVVKI